MTPAYPIVMGRRGA